MRLRPHPVVLVLIGILSVQFGAGLAKSLFDEVSPTTIVWLRLATSAVVLAAIARPVLRGRSRDDWLVVVGYGGTLAVMNWAIYQAFARIPLGLAVTIEFLGPLMLAVIGSRRATDLVWASLAAVGVALLGFKGGDLNPAGVAFALAGDPLRDRRQRGSDSVWSARYPALTGPGGAESTRACADATPVLSTDGADDEHGHHDDDHPRPPGARAPQC